MYDESVGTSASHSVEVQRLNAETRGEEVNLVLEAPKPGEPHIPFPGVPPHSRPPTASGHARFDATVVYLEDHGTQVSVPVTAVKAAEMVVDRGSAGVLGALAGSVSLGLLGGVAGYASAEDCRPNQIVCFGRGFDAFLVGAVGALVGGVAGAIIGASSGFTRRWEFHDGP